MTENYLVESTFLVSGGFGADGVGLTSTDALQIVTFEGIECAEVADIPRNGNLTLLELKDTDGTPRVCGTDGPTDCLVYDAATNTWTDDNLRLPSDRQNAAVVHLKNLNIYWIIGGDKWDLYYETYCRKLQLNLFN